MGRLFSIKPFIALPTNVREWTAYFSGLQFRDANTPIVGLYSGEGSPEGVVVATQGSIYTRTDGGATTTLYVKTSGSGATGWTAK